MRHSPCHSVTDAVVAAVFHAILDIQHEGTLFPSVVVVLSVSSTINKEVADMEIKYLSL